uniref:Carbohydrate sulfotransferase n=1 Tax=Ditylenchus dipsaci TaxID=166011 RepID=A0A915EAA3_9BILA
MWKGVAVTSRPHAYGNNPVVKGRNMERPFAPDHTVLDSPRSLFTVQEAGHQNVNSKARSVGHYSEMKKKIIEGSETKKREELSKEFELPIATIECILGREQKSDSQCIDEGTDAKTGTRKQRNWRRSWQKLREALERKQLPLMESDVLLEKKADELERFEASNGTYLQEEYGNDTLRSSVFNECNYPILRDAADVQRVKPIFLVRHPLATFASWKQQKWNDLDAFYHSLQNHYSQFKLAWKTGSVKPLVICYELLTEAKEETMGRICHYWTCPTPLRSLNMITKTFRSTSFTHRSGSSKSTQRIDQLASSTPSPPIPRFPTTTNGTICRMMRYTRFCGLLKIFIFTMVLA